VGKFLIIAPVKGGDGAVSACTGRLQLMTETEGLLETAMREIEAVAQRAGLAWRRRSGKRNTSQSWTA